MIIGYTDIVGDLFHYNHINFFKQCREYCDYLIVAVCSDNFCKGYKRKPILNENERLLSVSNSKYIDKCFIIDINNEPLNKEFMDKYNIDIVFHAHNEDENDKYNTYFSYPIQQNKFKRLDYNEGISTSKIINIIKEYY